MNKLDISNVRFLIWVVAIMLLALNLFSQIPISNVLPCFTYSVKNLLTGVIFTKLFSFITYKWALQFRLFVTGKPFQLGVM